METQLINRYEGNLNGVLSCYDRFPCQENHVGELNVTR